MTAWGFTGPILGPFEAVHFTYKEHIRCIDANAGTELELGFHDDLLVHNGKFYGDFKICGGTARQQRRWRSYVFTRAHISVPFGRSVYTSY